MKQTKPYRKFLAIILTIKGALIMTQAQKSRTSRLKKKLLPLALAACLAVPGGYMIAPAPQASAAFGWGSIIGAGIQGAAAHAQLTQVLKKYNDSEEGRQEFFEEMKKQYGVNNDAYLNNRLDTIMANLTSAIGAVDPTIYDKPYNYFINNDTSFNAFCTLGHNMSVNTGLFSVLTNEDEIAVVLGHEMGHGQKDHPAKGARRSLNMAIIGAATGSELGSIVTSVINNRNITKPMEREADALAFEYITHSNYNPGACAAVWQRVLDKSKTEPSALQQFLSDHPSDNDRRDAYVKKLTAYSNNHVTVKDGIVSVNGKEFDKPAPQGDMSAAERSYFVAGNLAAAYHNGHNKEQAYADGNTVMLGAQPIISCNSQDESAASLAETLNKIK